MKQITNVTMMAIVSAYGFYTGYHPFIPVVFTEIRIHVPFLDAFADGIRQASFQSVTGRELNAPFAGDQQNDQSVVTTFLADTVFLSQPEGEVETVASFNLFHSDYQCLDTGLFFEGKEGGIHDSYRFGRQDTVRIADIPFGILQMDQWNVFYLVFLCLQGNGQQTAQ